MGQLLPFCHKYQLHASKDHAIILGQHT